MNARIIEDRLAVYEARTQAEVTQALREIIQELILYALSSTDFFAHAAFQGGTCLRIIHGLNRFSEDMDFILLERDPRFVWQPWLLAISRTLGQFGFNVEIQDKSKLEDAVKKAFIKDDSIGNVIHLSRTDRAGHARKMKIKLEIDTNPPSCGTHETRYLGFPSVSSVTVETLPTLFAGKSHALLCREWVKGRDWYDFLWYARRNVSVDHERLAAALRQLGPWAGSAIAVDRHWYHEEMKKKIVATDWERAREDVSPFIRKEEQRSLSFWGNDLFLSTLDRLA